MSTIQLYNAKNLGVIAGSYTVYGIFANGTNSTVGTGSLNADTGRAVYNFTTPVCLSLYEAFVVNVTQTPPPPPPP